MIEKKLTHIWIGPHKPPLKWMHTWRDKHPDWEYSIFTDQMLKSRRWLNQDLIEHYYKTQQWCGVSDLIRYELLWEQGGFWPEADMECLNDTTELFTAPDDHAYSCYENERCRGNFIQPILAANPKNKFIEYILEVLRELEPHNLHPQPFESTGNAFLAKHWPKWKDKLHLWPSHYFIPLFYERWCTYYDGPDKVYANHHWGSTGMGWTEQYASAVE